MSFTERQGKSQAPRVSSRARQGAETRGRDWSWVEAGVWNERMLAALENGVKGGKWFSLIDKVWKDVWMDRWNGAPTAACGSTKAGETPGNGTLSSRSSALAQCLLRSPGTVHLRGSLGEVSEPIPMRKLPTGEPCAGEPHARFGGRGRRKPFPTPMCAREGATSAW